MKTSSQQAWQSIKPLFNSICKLPFITQLRDGTLPQQTFNFYLQQDNIYLISYAKALATVGNRIEDPQDSLLLFSFAKDALHSEREAIALCVENNIPASPTCFAYTQFLLSYACLQPMEVAFAAILPCFWIYREIAQWLSHQAIVTKDCYQKWIDIYTEQSFIDSTNKAINLFDKFSLQTTESIQNQMFQSFMTASRYEYMFWDSAFRLESWANVTMRS